MNVTQTIELHENTAAIDCVNYFTHNSGYYFTAIFEIVNHFLMNLVNNDCTS